jgi:hypothetical protein
VDYFYTATTRRSRAALWTTFTPALSAANDSDKVDGVFLVRSAK